MPKQRLSKRADGRFRCKYKNRYFYGNTQAEALQKRDQYKQAVSQNAWVGKHKTVAQYAAEWLPIHKVVHRATTYNQYAYLLDRLCDKIGKKLVQDVVPSDIKAVYTEMLGVSDSMLKKASSLYIGMFDSAVEDGICRVNPARSSTARRHHGTEGTHRAITEEERELIKTVPHRFQTGVMVMLYAGLSRSEAMGIIIERDVDLQAREIHVRGAVHQQDNKTVYEEQGKNKYRIRTVPIFDELYPYLIGKSGVLFTNYRTGKPLDLSSFPHAWQGYLRNLSKAAGHEIVIRSHDLRHSFATWLRDNGMEMDVAARLLGHCDTKMLQQVYDHIGPDRVKKQIERVNKNASRGQNGGQINDNNR